MLRGPCPHSLSQSWYCRIKSGRVGKVWGRKYPSVSPALPWPLLTYAHMTKWRVGVIICNYTIWWRTVFTLHGQMSDVCSVHNIHILASTRSDVWSIFGNVTTKRIIVDRDNWLENIASVNFLLAMIMAGMHGNIFYSCLNLASSAL